MPHKRNPKKGLNILIPTQRTLLSSPATFSALSHCMTPLLYVSSHKCARALPSLPAALLGNTIKGNAYPGLKGASATV